MEDSPIDLEIAETKAPNSDRKLIITELHNEAAVLVQAYFREIKERKDLESRRRELTVH